MQSKSNAGPKDPTFRSYSKNQAAAYAKSREGYSDTLYEYIVNHHTSTGGKLSFVVDVGCGPGNATKDLARYFEHAFGCDPGEEMINQANLRGCTTRTGEKVAFQVCSAENLNELPIDPGTVDLITCAMAAHWFQLETFYPAAARLLKPGGTLAMWTCGSYYVHPDTPNAEAIQRHFTNLESVVLAPYNLRGNLLSYHLYDTLDLPWTLDPPVCEKEFKTVDLHRKAWNRDGRIEDGKDRAFLSGGEASSLREIMTGLGTASMVTRWRAANYEKVQSGEIKDCINETFEGIRKVMGVQNGDEDHAHLCMGMATGLVMLKRQ